jgi:MoxR-like ATPase
MDENWVRIHDKRVQLSQPYRARVFELVGGEEEIKTILACWMGGEDIFPRSPLLMGEPGVGKNRIVYECARICSKELYIQQGHEDVTVEDLACAVRFSDDPNRKLDYILSPLATALVRGGICFVDEIGKIRPRALALLVSVLDERRYLDSTLLGERIPAHPGFRFIAATNTADLEGSLMPDFIKSRMRPVVPVGYPRGEEINRMVKTRYRRLSQNGDRLLDRFWDLWRKKNGEKPPVPRDSNDIFGFAMGLADYEEAENSHPFRLENRAFSPDLQERHLEAAFAAFYPGNEGRKK